MKNKSLGRMFSLMVIISLLVITFGQISLASSESGIFQMAGDIVITEDQVIDGDVDAMAGKITIYGVVKGNVTAMAGNIIIYGKVIGNVHCMVGRVQLRETAEVIGDVNVMAGKLSRDEGTKITGKLRELTGSSDSTNFSWNSSWFDGDDWQINFTKFPWWVVILWGTITGVISWLAISLLVMFFFTPHIQRLAIKVVEEPGIYFLLGLVALILTPVAAVLLGVTFIGIPLIPVLILGVIVGAIFGQIAIARVIGEKIKVKFNLKYQSELMRVVVGILVIFLLTLIPVVGWIFFLITICIGLGVVLKNRFGVQKKIQEGDEDDDDENDDNKN